MDGGPPPPATGAAREQEYQPRTKGGNRVEQIAVTIHSTDRLSEAGLATFLRQQPGLELLDRRKPLPPRANRPVAVVLADRITEAVIDELRQLSSRAGRPIVLVTEKLRDSEVITALQSGVRALLWRHQITPDRLAKAIRCAAHDVHDLPPDIVGTLLSLVEHLQHRKPTQAATTTGTVTGLTSREVDVLRLFSEGLETRQVAEKLAYSERTVKSILHRLITRLRLNNRTHAVAYALREGHIS